MFVHAVFLVFICFTILNSDSDPATMISMFAIFI